MTTIADDTKPVLTSGPEPEVAKRARDRIAWRLLPFLFLLYVIAFLDRMNVGAAALQMPHDLGFSEGVIGMGAGIFFSVTSCWKYPAPSSWNGGAHGDGSRASWLPSDEKSWITTELQREKEAKNRHRSYRVWEALRHRDVILLTVCYFCAMIGSYGIAFWLPTILKRLSGKSDLKVTLLAALPYVAAFVTQQVNGWHSDRTRERRCHAAIPVFVCGLALAFAVVYRSNLTMSVGLFVVAGGAFYGFQPVFWAVPTLFLSESAAAASIGLINAVGNLGGFVGPMVIGYLVNRTHSFSPGLLYLVGSLFVSGVLMLAVGRQAPAGQVSPS